jgi:hypothetical protein
MTPITDLEWAKARSAELHERASRSRLAQAASRARREHDKR